MSRTIFETINSEKVLDWEWLEPANGRKSFYQKAVVYETETAYYLQSYETLIARVEKGSGEVGRLSDSNSATATSHLLSFFYRKNVKLNKKEFYNLPIWQEEVTDGFVEDFKKDYDGLNPEIKEILAKSGVMIYSKKEAEELMAISQLFSLLRD
jgi:hypothetical protein